MFTYVQEGDKILHYYYGIWTEVLVEKVTLSFIFVRGKKFYRMSGYTLGKFDPREFVREYDESVIREQAAYYAYYQDLEFLRTVDWPAISLNTRKIILTLLRNKLGQRGLLC